MDTAEVYAEFIGGPYEGRRIPKDLVPWTEFVPRAPEDHSPFHPLSRDEVESQWHYRAFGFTGSARLYQWSAPLRADLPERAEARPVEPTSPGRAWIAFFATIYVSIALGVGSVTILGWILRAVGIL